MTSLIFLISFVSQKGFGRIGKLAGLQFSSVLGLVEMQSL
jgi:hypothetical protein